MGIKGWGGKIVINDKTRSRLFSGPLFFFTGEKNDYNAER
jgi:hypothetical protein